MTGGKALRESRAIQFLNFELGRVHLFVPQRLVQVHNLAVHFDDGRVQLQILVAVVQRLQGEAAHARGEEAEPLPVHERNHFLQQVHRNLLEMQARVDYRRLPLVLLALHFDN